MKHKETLKQRHARWVDEIKNNVENYIDISLSKAKVGTILKGKNSKEDAHLQVVDTEQGFMYITLFKNNISDNETLKINTNNETLDNFKNKNLHFFKIQWALHLLDDSKWVSTNYIGLK